MREITNYPEPLMGMVEMCKALGVTRSAIYGRLLRGTMCRPYVVLTCGQIWKTEDVAAWVSEVNRR